MRYAHAFPQQVRRRRNSFIAYARWVSDPRRRVVGLAPPSMSRRLPRAGAASAYNSGATQPKTLCNSGREGNMSRVRQAMSRGHYGIKLRNRMQKVRINLDVSNPASKVTSGRPHATPTTVLRLYSVALRRCCYGCACERPGAAAEYPPAKRPAACALPVSTRFGLQSFVKALLVGLRMHLRHVCAAAVPWRLPLHRVPPPAIGPWRPFSAPF